MSIHARITVPLLFLPLLTQCGSRSAPATNAVTGPFDSRGNYIEEWVDSPEKWHRPKAPGEKPESIFAKKQPAPQPPQIAVVEPRPSPTVSAPRPSPTVSAPKPKPKPVVVKPKPKPKVVKYTVKKGDNLSRIASRHGVGLSALRRANGISGDLIRPGQVLTIPK